MSTFKQLLEAARSIIEINREDEGTGWDRKLMSDEAYDSYIRFRAEYFEVSEEDLRDLLIRYYGDGRP